MIATLKLFLKGGVIGIANIIPGVSGGTMAVVLGIYEPLIESIGDFFTNRTKQKEYFIFLFKVLFGAGIAILIFSWVMDYLLNYYKSYTYLFFIGLIAGSIPAIYKTHPNMKLNIPSVITFLCGFGLIMFLSLSFTQQIEVPDTSGTFSFNYLSAGVLFFAGILSGGSMIVPGVSGSFMLVLLGQIRAVKNVDPLPLVFLGAGIGVGIWSFAKIIDRLLKRFPKETFYFILGLVFASLYPIFPELPVSLSERVVAVFVTLFAGLISYKLGESR
jgi:putative membrane protein